MCVYTYALYTFFCFYFRINELIDYENELPDYKLKDFCIIQFLTLSIFSPYFLKRNTKKRV